MPGSQAIDSYLKLEMFPRCHSMPPHRRSCRS